MVKFQIYYLPYKPFHWRKPHILIGCDQIFGVKQSIRFKNDSHWKKMVQIESKTYTSTSDMQVNAFVNTLDGKNVFLMNEFV